MTRKEFNDWLNYHQVVFPQVKTWLASEDVDFRALTTRWHDAMALAHLDDCKRCTDRMVAGAIEHPANYELHSLPAVVLKSLPYRAPRAEDLKNLDYNPQTGEITRKNGGGA